MVGVHPSHSAPETARVTKEPEAVRTLASSPSATPNFCGCGPLRVYSISSVGAAEAGADPAVWAAAAAAGSDSAVGGEGAAAFTAEVLMVLSARDTRSSPAAAAARGAAGILDAVPTLERAKEILAPAKRAPRARSADMAMVDMLRWTERSRGRRWCAPMRLSGGEARLLEWPRNVIGKKLRRNAWRNLSSAGPSLQILSQSPYGRNTCYEVCAKVVTMCLLAKYPFITVNTLITQVTDSKG